MHKKCYAGDKKMPKLVYHPKRDIPQAVRTLKTFSPKEISQWVLNRFNKKVTPEAITMWFKRHPDIYEQLKKEIIEEEKPKEVIETSIFQNGTFEELPSVKEWINQMKDRDLDDQVIKDRIGRLKRICKGQFPKWGIDLVNEGLWTYKHPDRLSLDDARELIRILKDKGVDTYDLRITLRDFLSSKGIDIKAIMGGKSKSYGKYAQLYVERDVLNKMLEWIKQQNEIVYYVDLFMFKTGTRISATLNIDARDIDFYDDHIEVHVFDKGRRSLYPKREFRGRQVEGKEWIKYVTDPELIKFFAFKREGLIFNVDYETVSKINKEAIKQFAPEILKNYGDVDQNHFWRHMFAQHMLRLCNWNYGIVAYLGGWTVQALQESYGMPTNEQLRQWGLSELPKL
jgi:integrase